MKRTTQRFKKGATSIYVVVIATLLFSVITVGFIRLIIREAGKTAEDELAQSAYDSALAGVEDAKLALKKANSDTTIKAQLQTYLGDDAAKTQCSQDIIQKILGRNSDAGKSGEVFVQENDSSGSTSTVQAYTCVLLDDKLSDYRATLSSTHTLHVVPLRAENVNLVAAIRTSWYLRQGNTSTTYHDGEFYQYSSANVPPVISAQVIQTATSYNLSQFDSTSGSQTNRMTAFLYPVNSGGSNTVSQTTLLQSNTHTQSNTAQDISCPSSGTSDYYCTATLQLPKPIGDGSRSQDTFFLVLQLPYGTPETDFKVEMLDSSGNPLDFKGVQIAIDSTGRANDMYSRVEARVEFTDINFPFPEYAIQATDTDGKSIRKDFYVTSDCWKTKEDGTVEACNNSGS